jgi:hypothetical protein
MQITRRVAQLLFSNTDELGKEAMFLFLFSSSLSLVFAVKNPTYLK